MAGSARASNRAPLSAAASDRILRRRFRLSGRKLAIEIDGGQHAQQEKEDAARTVEIARRGYRVIRFWNNDVMHNLAGVIEVIRRELECPLCPSGGEGVDPSLQRRGGEVGTVGALQSPPTPALRGPP